MFILKRSSISQQRTFSCRYTKSGRNHGLAARKELCVSFSPHGAAQVAYDVTTRAHEIAKTHSREAPPSVSGFGTGAKRVLQKDGLAADGKVMAKSLRCITYGEQEIELTYVEQLVEISQARAIADSIQFLSGSNFVDGKATLAEIMERIEEMITGKDEKVGEQGLDKLYRGYPCPFYALPRRFELGAAVNRLRSVKFVKRDPPAAVKASKEPKLR